MSRQVIGNFEQLLAATAVANGKPSGDQVGRLVVATAFPGAVPQSIDWLLRLNITIDDSPITTAEVDVHLWGRDAETPLWGTLGNDQGMINGGATVTCDGSQSMYFILQNLGLFQDLWLEARAIVGAGFSLSSDLAPFYNCEANGLVGNG